MKRILLLIGGIIGVIIGVIAAGIVVWMKVKNDSHNSGRYAKRGVPSCFFSISQNLTI